MTNYTKVIQAENEIKNQSFESAVIFDGEGNFLTWEDGKQYTVNLEKHAGKMKGNILTHNHPTKYAASFSPQDVKYFINNELSEIRAVDYKYTYSLVAKKELTAKVAQEVFAKYQQAVKELNEILKASIINDTECFEDIEHEAWTVAFKGSRTFKYTRVSN